HAHPRIRAAPRAARSRRRDRPRRPVGRAGGAGRAGPPGGGRVRPAAAAAGRRGGPQAHRGLPGGRGVAARWPRGRATLLIAMTRRLVTLVALFVVCLAVVVFVPAVHAAGLIEGTHEGADFLIGMPERWNGGLVLYAHGYDGEGQGRGSLSGSPM